MDGWACHWNKSEEFWGKAGALGNTGTNAFGWRDFVSHFDLVGTVGQKIFDNNNQLGKNFQFDQFVDEAASPFRRPFRRPSELQWHFCILRAMSSITLRSCLELLWTDLKSCCLVQIFGRERMWRQERMKESKNLDSEMNRDMGQWLSGLRTSFPNSG